MGQLLSSEEGQSQVKDAIGSLLYDAMLEGGAVPELGVVHPRLLTNHNQGFGSRAGLQEQLKLLQGHMGNRAPTYLKDLIGRLSTFSDEPQLAGLVGLVVTMVMDMAFTSSKKQSSGVKEKSASSQQQRVWELQELMEEFLKRCRINLNDKNKLIQDVIRLEAQFSLTLTQLKTCLLAADCDSRSLRHWASGAAFHTQMLVNLASLEGHVEPLGARAAMEQYKEDLTQIIPAYRRYKSNTVAVVKRRGGLLGSCDPSSDTPEDGSMTGLTVTDRETGKSVTVPLSAMETQIGRTKGVPGPDTDSATIPSCVNLDLITSDQYAEAYLHRLFSREGPVAELEHYFTTATDNLRTLRCEPGGAKETGLRNGTEENNGECTAGGVAGVRGEQRVESGDNDTQGRKEQREGREETEERERRGEDLKLSIVETNQSPHRNLQGATSE